MDERLVPGAMTREMRRIGREAGRTRAFAPSVHVGDPDGERLAVALLPWYDAGARVDLVVRALESLATPEPMAWLRRTGELDATDADWAWLAAARAGFGVHGLALPRFHVVTRHGWHDLLGGARAEWPRVRVHQV